MNRIQAVREIMTVFGSLDLQDQSELFLKMMARVTDVDLITLALSFDIVESQDVA